MGLAGLSFGQARWGLWGRQKGLEQLPSPGRIGGPAVAVDVGLVVETHLQYEFDITFRDVIDVDGAGS